MKGKSTKTLEQSTHLSLKRQATSKNVAIIEKSVIYPVWQIKINESGAFTNKNYLILADEPVVQFNDPVVENTFAEY